MRVLLVHAVEEIVLLADRRLQVLAGDVLAVSVPQHFNHSRQRPHDVTFRLVGPAKEVKLSPMNRSASLSLPVHVLLVIVLQQELRERAGVAKALNNAVHVARIAQVLQARQAALLERKRSSRN